MRKGKKVCFSGIDRPFSVLTVIGDLKEGNSVVNVSNSLGGGVELHFRHDFHSPRLAGDCNSP